jgi:hypothetical protein
LPWQSNYFYLPCRSHNINDIGSADVLFGSTALPHRPHVINGPNFGQEASLILLLKYSLTQHRVLLDIPGMMARYMTQSQKPHSVAFSVIIA